MKTAWPILLGLICILELSSCATFNMLNSDLPLPQRMFIYSGTRTRLDWAAITNNEASLKRFKVEPPCEPLIDLPFSFALDSIFLPKSIYAEIFH
jgi:uncharacterized protein YceK